MRELSNKAYTISEYFERLGKYYHLLVALTKRELKTKYSRTILGISWVILQPALAIIVYSIFFRFIFHMDTGRIPYPQFVFSGLIIWYIFSGFVSKGALSLLEMSDIIKKVSFPRLIALLAKIFPSFIEGLVLLIMLFTWILVTGTEIGWQSIFVSFYLLEAIVFSLMITILLSICVVRFRDVLHLLPVILNFGVWLTPVFYSSSMIPEPYNKYLLIINPLADSIEGLRLALFHNGGITLQSVYTFGGSLVLLTIALVFFIKFEKRIIERL